MGVFEPTQGKQQLPSLQVKHELWDGLITFDKWPLKGGYLYPSSVVCLFSDLAISTKDGINESKQTFGKDMHFYEVNSSLGKEGRL